MEGGQLVALMHGNILHGAEYTDAARWRDTLGYYTRRGPVGQLIAARPEARRIAVIGLGSGAMACFAKPAQD